MSRLAVHSRRLGTAGFAVCFLVLTVSPTAAGAREPFAGYPEDLRRQAERVVGAAGPGAGAELALEVALLRKRMLALGILSMNELPERIFEKAAREGWKDEAAGSLRAAAPVSAFSVPMWLWLVKEDVTGFRFGELFEDAASLAGALRKFEPARLGATAWLSAVSAAAAAWFALWVGTALLLRARPSLEHDLMRLVAIPFREYLSPVLAVLLFLVPVAVGAGPGTAACFWLLLAVAYLRRIELFMAVVAVLALAGAVAAGGALQVFDRVAADAARGGWISGEGHFPAFASGAAGMSRPDSGGDLAWKARFAKARAAMAGGDPEVASHLWTELLAAGRHMPEVLNNRGIARAQQGKLLDALADFQAAGAKDPGDGPALWNAYQIHLQTFSLESARDIQPRAWEEVRRMTPFRFRPADMDPGEWIASALPAGGVWREHVRGRGGLLSGAPGSALDRLQYRPFPAVSALVVLVAVLAGGALIRVVASRIWLSGTCRVCGDPALMTGSRESSDLCTACRGRIGEGARSGEDRDRRILAVSMHGRYVKACSMLVPGSGSLWAGKTFRAMLYGLLLAAALGVVTVTLGGGGGGLLTTSLREAFAAWAIGAAGAVWAAGAMWSIRSFTMLQRRHHIATLKR
jgi:tetratricopeptide (TPR) repeat protein